MTKYITILCFALVNITFAQVGINTDDPKTTLDVHGTNHLGAVTATDGVLVPRVDDLSTSGSVEGQLVYLIANSGSFTPGFHYWDGETPGAWQPLKGSASSVNTLYSADDTVTANRNVDLDNNNLTIDGDGVSLGVNGTSGLVSVTAAASPGLQIIDGNESAGRVLTAIDNLGNAEWQDAPTGSGGNNGSGVAQVVTSSPVTVGASDHAFLTNNGSEDFNFDLPACTSANLGKEYLFFALAAYWNNLQWTSPSTYSAYPNELALTSTTTNPDSTKTLKLDPGYVPARAMVIMICESPGVWYFQLENI